MDEHARAKLLRVLRIAGLPTRIPRIRNRSGFFAALDADKKQGPGGVEFVLLKNIGHAVVGVRVPSSFIKEAMQLS
jgi:3-dehydroquinate synthetase